MMYGPLAPAYMRDEPQWSFDALGGSTRGNDSDDASSNAPALGSDNGESLAERMMEDFGDDELGTLPGASTPLRFQPMSGVEDEEVKEIHVEAD